MYIYNILSIPTILYYLYLYYTSTSENSPSADRGREAGLRIAADLVRPRSRMVVAIVMQLIVIIIIYFRAIIIIIIIILITLVI